MISRIAHDHEFAPCFFFPVLPCHAYQISWIFNQRNNSTTHQLKQIRHLRDGGGTVHFLMAIFHGRSQPMAQNIRSKDQSARLNIKPTDVEGSIYRKISKIKNLPAFSNIPANPDSSTLCPFYQWVQLSSRNPAKFLLYGT
jgi:hypothetical protein